MPTYQNRNAPLAEYRDFDQAESGWLRWHNAAELYGQILDVQWASYRCLMTCLSRGHRLEYQIDRACLLWSGMLANLQSLLDDAILNRNNALTYMNRFEPDRFAEGLDAEQQQPEAEVHQL